MRVVVFLALLLSSLVTAERHKRDDSFCEICKDLIKQMSDAYKKCGKDCVKEAVNAYCETKARALSVIDCRNTFNVAAKEAIDFIQVCCATLLM
ncbi:hypothetical protein OESDEN_04157 [Oesophagostomum dentatum]|uniref:Saposin B-type domain-containing protein n=1 Tax=Oesophagostomum dentatum TaxID=61180 RepID=A0A0B1TE99_OESDE|nr:hypothetical protein OESDEN_04157 [Oesophagostomum dentatum]